MGYLSRKSELTTEQARQLLADVSGVAIREIEQIGFTNDVFRVTTTSHGNYYVKFYTARWYKDSTDLSGNVEEELAAYHILQRRGISLPYKMWGDCSRRIVNEPVLITSELPGAPLPSVVEEHPEDSSMIWETLGRYLRCVHQIPFTNPGPLGPEHRRLATSSGVIPYATIPRAGDASPRMLAENRQREALSVLEKAAGDGFLSSSAAGALRTLFGGMADVVEQELARPRFTQLNVHDHHFHLRPEADGWQITGFYDFEHASASDPHADLVGLETTVTPRAKSYAWRAPFFRGYGEVRSFDSLKMGLLLDLLVYLRDARKTWVPDPGWLAGRWEMLVGSQSLEELEWYPVSGTMKPATQQG